MGFFFKRNSGSAFLAKKRIGLLVFSERIDCSTQMMQMMRQDLIHTVKKYTEIDEKQVVLKILKSPATLQFEFPVVRKRYIKKDR